MKTIAIKLTVLGTASALCLLGTACPKPQVTPDDDKMPVAVRPVAKKNTPHSRFAEGVAAMEASDWATGRVKFEQALELADNLTTARYNLALCLQKLGELEPAAEIYQDVLGQNGNHLDAALNLAKIRRDQVRFAEGIVVLQKLRKANPYEGRLLNDLAVLFRLAKKYKKAEKALRTLLSRDAENSDAHKNLALVHYDQGAYRLAEFMMGTAKRRNEKDPGIYNNLGMIAMKRGDMRSAFGNFQKAVELDAKFAPGHLNLGAYALSFRDYQAAAESFAKAVNLDAASWEAHHYYALSLEGGQDLEGAAREFAAVQKIRPNYPPAAYGLCKSLQNTRPDEAEGHCKRFMGMKGARPADVENAKGRIESIQMMREIKASEAAAPPPEPEPEPVEEPPAEEGAAEPAGSDEPEAAPADETAPATPDPEAEAAEEASTAEVEAKEEPTESEPPAEEGAST